MMQTDEIRGNVSLSPLFFGETRLGLNGSCCPNFRRGLFIGLSFVVVYRFTLHAGSRKTAAAPVRKSHCWLSGSPAQKGRCVNPRRRCGVPELPGELNNVEESWPRSSSALPDPFPCCSATTDRSPIGAGHYFWPPLRIKRGYGRKNGARLTVETVKGVV